MKQFFLLAILFASLTLVAQKNVYVAAKSGLSIRDKPDAKATVLAKIPFGTKVSISYPDSTINIITEGMTSPWAIVTYGGKKGYIVSAYLLPYPPPKTTVKTMKEYLAQLGPVFGSKLILKSGTMQNMEEVGYSELRQQLYKNGCEHHEFYGYEYNSNTYFLPDMRLEQGYLLTKLIPEFSEVWAMGDLPTENKTVKKGDEEYSITVEKEMLGDLPWIKRIKIQFASGAFYDFEMYSIDNQLVIFFGGGV